MKFTLWIALNVVRSTHTRSRVGRFFEQRIFSMRLVASGQAYNEADFSTQGHGLISSPLRGPRNMLVAINECGDQSGD